MITVDMHLLSAISPDRSKRLSHMTICNVGGTKTKGNYDVTVYGKNGQVVRRGVVTDYPRLAVAPLNLLHRALEATGYTK